jgi:tetratricopeptide (TPR) repeat protein
VLAWLDENEPADGRNPWLRARRAEVLAMLGRFDEGRATLYLTRADLIDRGGGVQLAGITGQLSEVEFLAGDLAAAVELGEEACRLLDELGERSMLSTDAGKLARVLYAFGRLEEADAWAGRAAELGASDDALTQMLWRQVKAKILASHGDHTQAEHLAREAVAIGERTDMLDAQGDMYVDLAEVLSLGGRPVEAAEAFERALDCYERKGNLVSAGHVRARLAEVDDAGRL